MELNCEKVSQMILSCIYVFNNGKSAVVFQEMFNTSNRQDGHFGKYTKLGFFLKEQLQVGGVTGRYSEAPQLQMSKWLG